ncbi:MAG: hypothetical protein GF355_10655 [Candidatus Eisenbacteria bacterium]|nr:hypothetical protein [Candidatus Eisenbacteria bacterium]
MSDGTSQNNGYPGDPILDQLVPNHVTYDAARFDIEFTCEGAAEVSVLYTFWSEKYNEYVYSDYNDVMALFLNGTDITDNIAVVPGFCSTGGIPVAIDNVNCDNPYGGPNGVNCDCYINNDLDDGGGSIDTEMDGGTFVFFAEGALVAGVNTLTIAIADAGDYVLDSNVFIQCGTLVCEQPPAFGACCDDTTCYIATQQNCEDAGHDYQGDDTDCGPPNPCVEPTPTEGSTWGRIKSIYR